jgi:threonine dehydrogenase-like Zn-dependent dehydrogenase
VSIVISDISPFRLALAERIGAHPIDATTATLPDVLATAGLKPRVEIAIDTAGRTSVRRQLLDSLDRRGVLVCVGHGESLELSVSEDLIAPERTIMGSEYFPYGDLPINLELLLANRDYVAQIITHHLPVREVEEAYRIFLSGEAGKVVIEQ